MILSVALIDIESLQNRLLKVCYVPATSASLPRVSFFFSFLFLLLRPLPVLMKQTRWLKQFISLDVYGCAAQGGQGNCSRDCPTYHCRRHYDTKTSPMEISLNSCCITKDIKYNYTVNFALFPEKMNSIEGTKCSDQTLLLLLWLSHKFELWFFK